MIELEQPSEFNAEVITNAEPQTENKPEIPETYPRYISQCIELVKVSDSTEVVPNVKCIQLSDGKLIFGIILSEIVDSFLVGVAARLIMGPDKEIYAEPLSSESVCRIMKSSVMFIHAPADRFLYHYYVFLAGISSKFLPEYFTEAKVKHITKNIERYEFQKNSTRKPEQSSKVEVPGASNSSFIPLQFSEKIH